MDKHKLHKLIPNVNAQQWRTIPFAPNYEISEWGLVRRINDNGRAKAGHILANTWHRFGYPRIKLTIDGKHKTFEVHYLVATIFLGKRPSPRHEVAHFPDNAPNNTHYLNLSWVTRKENLSHSLIHGTRARGEKCGRSVLKEKQVIQIKLSNESCRVLGRKYGVNPETIRSIKNGKSWYYL